MKRDKLLYAVAIGMLRCHTEGYLITSLCYLQEEQIKLLNSDPAMQLVEWNTRDQREDKWPCRLTVQGIAAFEKAIRNEVERGFQLGFAAGELSEKRSPRGEGG